MKEIKVDEKSETIDIKDLDTFVAALNMWHTGAVKTIEHILDVPEGTEVEVETKSGDMKTIALTGNTHSAFLLGITIALEQLGTLPFKVEYEDAVDE